MAELIAISSDRDLVDATRHGDESAWGALGERHRPALLRVARAGRSSGAPRRADVAWDTVRDAALTGDLDLDAVATDSPQVRDVRCRAYAALTGGAVGPALPPPHHRPDESRRTEVPDRQDLLALATAFLQAPWAWQTVVWHGRAEARTAAEIGPLLGRSANDVTAFLQSAESGLFELYLRTDAERIADLDSTSAALLPLIGGHRRGVLSPIDRRRVDELLERRTEGDPAGLHAQRWLAVGASLDSMIPEALVPGLVGQSVDRFWAVLGVGSAAVGTAALAAARSERVQRMARIGAVAAIIVAILGAAFLIRNPFDGLDATLISELIASESTTPGQDVDDGDMPATTVDQTDQTATTTDVTSTSAPLPVGVVEGAGGAGSSGGGTGGDATTGGTGGTGTTAGTPTTGTTGGGTTGGTPTTATTGGTGTTGGTPTTGTTGGGTTGGTGGTGGTTGGTTVGTTPLVVDNIDDMIRLGFPDARQGAVYVPGQDLLELAAALSVSSSFRAGGTGTLGLAVTNNGHDEASVRMVIGMTPGLRLVSGSGGSATSAAGAGDTAGCSFVLPAGATISLTMVFGLDADLAGTVTIVPGIPGDALTVPIV